VTLEHAKVVHAAVGAVEELEAMKINHADTVPAFCRVQVVDRPSEDSEIKTEIWLPLKGWNGRLRAQGNGGFAGSIYFDAMAETVRQGYATVGTDTGHVGGTPEFALGHPEEVKDFGWRAVHDMTVQAKMLIKVFYGRQQDKAYFTSCSDGGREALMEAQRFPADYDGILAGAPAYNWTALLSGGAFSAKRMSASEGALSAEKIPALAAAVDAACDAKDGVKDGVLNDPRECRFDPATMVCKAGETADCLSAAQADTVKQIYGGAVANEIRLPGLEPGAEDGREGWTRWITGDGREASMVFYSRGYFANFVYARPDWKSSEFVLDRDYTLASERTAADLNATDTNLSPFLARGGKLILYHGWNDPGIPAQMSIDYFDGVRGKTGEQATESGVRLYMVPGMQHCAFGPGATEFGQGMGVRGDASHDVFTALEGWVEKGSAPAVLTAIKTEGKGTEKTVVMTRPLCPYPQVAKYDGKGDATKAESFRCVAGKR
jgi:feruloyl esterase